MTAAPTASTLPEVAEQFDPCGRCSLSVRRSEMAIHLAHAHNVGPDRPKDKDKKKRRSDAR